MFMFSEYGGEKPLQLLKPTTSLGGAIRALYLAVLPDTNTGAGVC